MARTITTLCSIICLLFSEEIYSQKLGAKDYFRAISEIWVDTYLFDCTTYDGDSTRDLELLLTETLGELDSINSQSALCDLLNRKFFLRHDSKTAFAVYGVERGEVFDESSEPVKMKGSIWYWDLRKLALTEKYPIMRIDSILQGIKKDTLILDLRFKSFPAYGSCSLLLPFFIQGPATTVAETKIVHEGWNERYMSEYNYTKKWVTSSPIWIYPINKNKNKFLGKNPSKLRPFLGTIIALTNAYSLHRLGPILDILQDQKNCQLIHENKTLFSPMPDQRQYLDSVFLEIKTKTFHSKRGGLGVMPDVTIEVLDDWIGIWKAINKLENTVNIRRTPNYPALPDIKWIQFKDSLNRAERLTGLAKLYGILKYFYPFYDENKIDLGKRLDVFFDRCYGEMSFESYYQLLSEFVQPLHDSHVAVWSNKLYNEKRFTIPVRFEKVEGRTIVVESIADSLIKKDRLLPIGTEILKIDDKEIDDFESEWIKRISSSYRDAAYRNLYSYDLIPMVLCGPQNSEIRLSVRYPKSDTSIHVTLKRTTQTEKWYKKERKPSYRLLDGDIGYMDLSEIYNLNDYETALNLINKSRFIIVDLRKRPGLGSVKDIISPFCTGEIFMGWEEVPKITFDNSRNVSFRGRSYLKTDYWFVNEKQLLIDKPLVILINENTQSGTEDVANSFLQLTHAISIGSHTASTTGALSWIRIPNFGYCTFTGNRVKNASGDLFYAKGISPDIIVRRTLDGVLSGKDEVLDEAVKYFLKK